MTNNVLIPSIEERLRGFIEVKRRNLQEHGFSREARLRQTITLTREFGCEGYPVALKLQALMEKRTGAPWVVMDRALLDAVAADNHLSAEVLQNVGSRTSFVHEVISTFSPRWKTDQDYYRLLSHQILALAYEGHVIIVGRGAAILTQQTGNCYHFRIVAPMQFKIDSIAARMGVSPDEAHDVIKEKQRQRDAFLKNFTGRDITDPTLYHLVFNNARCSSTRIATLMADVVLPRAHD
jgi:cytidylate kinase